MHFFYLTAIIVFLSLHVFCAGTIHFFFTSKLTKIIFWVLPLLGPAIIILSFGLNRRSEGEIAGFFALLGHFWTGIIFLLFVSCLVMVLSQIGLSLFKIDAKQYIGVAGITIFFLMTIAAIAGGYQDPTIKTVEFKDAALPVEKLNIVQLSDTHLGTGVSLKRVERMVEQVNALHPDLILITGDFFENGEDLMEANAMALRNLKAKYGVYGSLGNHEFYRGLQKSIIFFGYAGVTLLRGQSAEPIPGIIVSGLDDITTTKIKKKDFNDFLSALDHKKYNILMEHEPKYFKTAANKVNLMLSGHTHNGQIFPFNFLVKLRYKYVYGPYTIGKTNFYITSGTFYWGPPMRLFSRNEIANIIITK